MQISFLENELVLWYIINATFFFLIYEGNKLINLIIILGLVKLSM
jgi:hypothetical protein